MKYVVLLTLYFWMSIQHVSASSIAEQLQRFEQTHVNELPDVIPCPSNNAYRFTLCSDMLRNEGNGPFILHHATKTEKVFLLIHGLSDSPFFLRAIAQSIHQKGHNVVVILLPGHGKKEADDDMEDKMLSERWKRHVIESFEFAKELGHKPFIGGFSTGAALATDFVLEHPNKVEGLLLFSGALALNESVENMAGLWGIDWLTKFLDGKYETDGPNPYKYPSVAAYSALHLTELIFSIRERLEKGGVLNVPTFAAHSLTDKTTPWSGIESLIENNQASSATFLLEKDLAVCHADVVVSEDLLEQMQFDWQQADYSDKCNVPHANPMFDQMVEALASFIDKH